MERLTPNEAVEAYHSGAPSSVIIDYDPEEHGEEMRCLATGLVGACIKLELPSLSGPQIGSRIPLVVVNVPGDLLRMFIDPHVEPYGSEYKTTHPYMQKAREHVELTALSYEGEPMLFDTGELLYSNWRDLSLQLQYQYEILNSKERVFDLEEEDEDLPF